MERSEVTMLVGLTGPGGRTRPDGVADRLLACHERIRRFSALGVTIASSVAAPASEVAAAAEAVHRYFTIALPLHVADEDVTIAPRLLALAPDGPVAQALAKMTREHATIEDLIAGLAPLWAAAAKCELTASELARHLAAANRLEELLAAHLSLEEGAIFAALARLDPPTAAAIVAEMRARRGA